MLSVEIWEGTYVFAYKTILRILVFIPRGMKGF